MSAVLVTLQQAFATGRAHLQRQSMATLQELGFVFFYLRVGQSHLSKTPHGNYDQLFAEVFVCRGDPVQQHVTVLGALMCDPSRHPGFGLK
jgi:hypothetical protein